METDEKKKKEKIKKMQREENFSLVHN